MKPLLRILIVLAVAAAAAVAGLYAGQAVNRPAGVADGVAPDAAQRLLATTLPDADGLSHAVSEWSGRVLVANFWATWCPPCIKEIPEFAEVARRYKDAPVQFVGLSIDSAENVRDFRERFDVPYPLLVGASDTLALAEAFGNTARALPFTVILDREGEVADVTLGTLSEDELVERIEGLLHP
ncbi:MAG: TlpA family protein disulfide reductase [Azoarcus sp.]|nr:TlpA family protein disulfide reductase [Azoarcus sp.]